MPLLRFLILPLRILLRLYYGLRNLARGGDVLFHELPDRFTMLRPSGLLAYFAPRQEAHLLEYQALLKVFAESDSLSTLVYRVPDVEASWAEVEQLGRALARIARAGKQLIAYGEGGNLKSLYLMSFARRRYAAPHANFILNYPATEGYFLKDTIARFGVTVETHHAGKFKAEGFEMFTAHRLFSGSAQESKRTAGRFSRIDRRALSRLRSAGGSRLLQTRPPPDPGGKRRDSGHWILSRRSRRGGLRGLDTRTSRRRAGRRSRDRPGSSASGRDRRKRSACFRARNPGGRVAKPGRRARRRSKTRRLRSRRRTRTAAIDSARNQSAQTRYERGRALPSPSAAAFRASAFARTARPGPGCDGWSDQYGSPRRSSAGLWHPRPAISRAHARPDGKSRRGRVFAY